MTTSFADALPKEQLACLPTDEDVAFYEEHGWFITQRILSDELLDAAQLGAQRFYRGERDAQLPPGTGYSDWKPQDGNTLRNNEFVSLQIHAIAQLLRQSLIGAVAGRLARTKEIRLLDDQLVFKPSHASSNTTVGWHADKAYWATCSSDNLLTAWIPFHDVDESRAPLVVIDGSHKWPDLDHTRFFNDTNLDGFEEVLRRRGHNVRRVPIVLKKGQVSFHHGWTLHASYPNRSDHHRLALAAHLQDQDNVYRAFRNAQGKEIHIFDETLCRKLPGGDPDFSDPAVFPVLWSEQHTHLDP